MPRRCASGDCKQLSEGTMKHIIRWFERRIWPWSELSRLRNWKAEQIAVEASWDEQAVGRQLELPLGFPIRPFIEPRIGGLKERLARLSEEVQRRESFHEQTWLKQAAVY